MFSFLSASAVEKGGEKAKKRKKKKKPILQCTALLECLQIHNNIPPGLQGLTDSTLQAAPTAFSSNIFKAQQRHCHPLTSQLPEEQFPWPRVSCSTRHRAVTSLVGLLPQQIQFKLSFVYFLSKIQAGSLLQEGKLMLKTT